MGRGWGMGRESGGDDSKTNKRWAEREMKEGNMHRT